MPKCFFPGCESVSGSGNCRLFVAPNKSTDEWTRILRRYRSDKFNPKNSDHRLCNLHFNEDDFIKGETIIINGKEELFPYPTWRLKKSAIPTVFPSLQDLQPPQITERRHLKRKALSDVTNLNKTIRQYPPSSKLIPDLSSNHSWDSSPSNSATIPPLSILTKENDQDKFWERLEGLTTDWTLDSTSSNAHIVFLKCAVFEDIPTTSKSLSVNKLTGNYVGMLQTINVTEALIAETKLKKITSVIELNSVLHAIAKLELCPGISGYQNILTCLKGTLLDGVWKAKNCERYGQFKVCRECKSLVPALQTHLYRTKSQPTPKPKFANTSRCSKENYYKKKLAKVNAKYLEGKGTIKALQADLKKLNASTIEDQLNSLPVPLPPIMKSGILHAVKYAKSKPNARRYSSDWLLECLLLHIKSPAAYKHLREGKILPLPHPCTLHRLISGQECRFGFNKISLEAIQREFRNKPRRDKQGVLIFDEVQLREGVELDKKLMRFNGFIDFGEFTNELVEEGDQEKLANHALVIMYRPLNADWVQPIGVFATRHAAKGNALEKLVLAAVLKVEAIGAEVNGIVCDGSKPNKAFWKRLGINGYKDEVVNKIVHPCDEARFLYFFSDVPHLIKCTRNNFEKYGEINFQGFTLNFQYYNRLLRQDMVKKDGLRKCPRLSRSHVSPNSFEKMRVGLATQLFSRSVATGLCFYRNLKYSDFYGSEATQKFTQLMNDIFDILNGRHPKDGINTSSDKFKHLQEFANILTAEINEANKSYNKGKIFFAAKETIAAFRVTVASTIDMVKYLTLELGFRYVLTAKFNQDCLEKFFGILRAAGGREDHPTISNFIQLYRLLNLYSPVKRIVRGNITDNENEQLCVLSQFQQSLKESAERASAIQKEREQDRHEVLLDRLIGMNNYATSRSLRSKTRGAVTEEEDEDEAKLNLVYYLVGYLCYKAPKYFNCVNCIKTISSDDPNNLSCSRLVNIMNEGHLKYPSEDFFKFINLGIEKRLTPLLKNVNSYGDIILKCIDEMANIDISSIGCDVDGHKYDLLLALVPFYITLRLHFYARSLKNDLGKGKATKNSRKMSKLSSS